MLDKEQFDKLPRYARIEIQRLQANLAAAEDRLRTILEPATNTVVVFNPNSYHAVRLPFEGTLRLYVGKADPSSYIEVEWDGATQPLKSIEVRTSRGLLVRPVVSNAVEITYAKQ